MFQKSITVFGRHPCVAIYVLYTSFSSFLVDIVKPRDVIDSLRLCLLWRRDEPKLAMRMKIVHTHSQEHTIRYTYITFLATTWTTAGEWQRCRFHGTLYTRFVQHLTILAIFLLLGHRTRRTQLRIQILRRRIHIALIGFRWLTNIIGIYIFGTRTRWINVNQFDASMINWNYSNESLVTIEKLQLNVCASKVTLTWQNVLVTIFIAILNTMSFSTRKRVTTFLLLQWFKLLPEATLFRKKQFQIECCPKTCRFYRSIDLPCHNSGRRSPFAIVRHVHWCQLLWSVLHWMVDANAQPFRMFPPLDSVCSAQSVRTVSEIVHHLRHRIYCPAIGSWRVLLCHPSALIAQNRLVYFAIRAPKMNRSCHVPVSISQLLCPINFRETICSSKTKQKNVFFLV